MKKTEKITEEKKKARRERVKRLERELRQKTFGYIIAAFGLVAGLAWNDAIKIAIEYVFPFSTETIIAKLIYAIVITLIVVLLSIYIMGSIGEDEKKRK